MSRSKLPEMMLKPSPQSRCPFYVGQRLFDGIGTYGGVVIEVVFEVDSQSFACTCDTGQWYWDNELNQNCIHGQREGGQTRWLGEEATDDRYASYDEDRKLFEEETIRTEFAQTLAELEEDAAQREEMEARDAAWGGYYGQTGHYPMSD